MMTNNSMKTTTCRCSTAAATATNIKDGKMHHASPTKASTKYIPQCAVAGALAICSHRNSPLCYCGSEATPEQCTATAQCHKSHYQQACPL
jgi:hypothetical protein